MDYCSGVKMGYRKNCDAWRKLLLNHSLNNPPHCESMVSELPELYSMSKSYPSTGSHYKGTCNILGMRGKGVYTLPNGVFYKGELLDGQFHGAGALHYSDGTVIRGVWRQGELMKRTLFFQDSCVYAEEDWSYCTMPDRRFTIEYKEGLRPAGRSYMTARQPTPALPDGCYDTVDGFYDPNINMVCDYGNPTEIIRAPSKHEREWIMANCRRNDTLPCGPRQDLYEEWVEMGPLEDISSPGCPCQL